MKSTGIIRRIDDLGRVVIPKEIRKNLNIKENDSLEIFIDGENIILKKYSNLSKVEKLFNKYINILNEITSNSVIITDREKVLATTKKEEKLIGKEISAYLDNILESRNKVLSNDNRGLEITKGNILEGNYYILPMIVNSDINGLIIIISNNEISDLSKVSLEIINKIIISSME